MLVKNVRRKSGRNVSQNLLGRITLSAFLFLNITFCLGNGKGNEVATLLQLLKTFP